MFKYKSLLTTTLLFIVIAFCSVLIMFSVSFAETQNTEQTETTSQDSPEGEGILTPDIPTNPEVVDPEAAGPEEVNGESNAECAFNIFLSDGTTPATPGIHYSYTERAGNHPGKVSVLDAGNGLVVSNIDPSIPAYDSIVIENKPAITDLTLKNVNIELGNSLDNAISIRDNFTNDYTFNLMIEGECKIDISGNYYTSCLRYETRGSNLKNFNVIGAQGSKLSLISNGYAYGIDAIAYNSCNMTVSICGYLNLYTDAVDSINLQNYYEDPDPRTNLIIKDSVSVEIHDQDIGLVCEGNVIFQDNAYIKIDSSHAGFFLNSNPDEDVWQPFFSVLGNASADIASQTEDAIHIYGTSININTTGYVNVTAPNGFAYCLYYDKEPAFAQPNLNVISGILYLSGNLIYEGTSFGLMEVEKPFSMHVADSYKIVGSTEQGAAIDALPYNAYLEDQPGYDEYYSMFVDSEANEPQLAKTVAFIPPETPTPEPEPTPGEEIIAAQTGDGMSSVVALCVIIAIASASYVLGRKLRKN